MLKESLLNEQFRKSGDGLVWRKDGSRAVVEGSESDVRNEVDECGE